MFILRRFLNSNIGEQNSNCRQKRQNIYIITELLKSHMLLFQFFFLMLMFVGFFPEYNVKREKSDQKQSIQKSSPIRNFSKTYPIYFHFLEISSRKIFAAINERIPKMIFNVNAIASQIVAIGLTNGSNNTIPNHPAPILTKNSDNITSQIRDGLLKKSFIY
jgi:hypothetical protein